MESKYTTSMWKLHSKPPYVPLKHLTFDYTYGSLIQSKIPWNSSVHSACDGWTDWLRLPNRNSIHSHPLLFLEFTIQLCQKVNKFHSALHISHPLVFAVTPLDFPKVQNKCGWLIHSGLKPRSVRAAVCPSGYFHKMAKIEFQNRQARVPLSTLFQDKFLFNHNLLTVSMLTVLSHRIPTAYSSEAVNLLSNSGLILFRIYFCIHRNTIGFLFWNNPLGF